MPIGGSYREELRERLVCGFVKSLINIKSFFKKPYETKANPDPKFTPEQKEHNLYVSKTRVFVENAIGGIKRYNILVQEFRNKSELLRDKSIFLAAALWNWTKGFSFAKQ